MHARTALTRRFLTRARAGSRRVARWAIAAGLLEACMEDWTIRPDDFDASETPVVEGSAAEDAGPEGAADASDFLSTPDAAERDGDAVDATSGACEAPCMDLLPAPRDAATDDPCEGQLCEHGGVCEAQSAGFRCECAGTGFQGRSCEEDIDECKAGASCDAPYPCTNALGGYSCLGQFADWPMPDAAQGSNLRPQYERSRSDAVVRDIVTGLSWQRLLPATYATCTPPSASEGACTRVDASAYCEQLVLDGLEDWRLPSKIELESLLDFTRDGVSIDDDVFPASGFPVWSISPAARSGEAWVVDFALGANVIAPESSRFRVRCVRGARAGTTAQRYIIERNAGTVLDTRTGLLWRENEQFQLVSAAGAAALCARLGDYRLPTVKELLTIMAPARAPALDPEVFPNYGPAEYWSSTVVEGATVPSTFAVRSIDGLISALPADYSGTARCVR